jgi:hypothetical protein
MIHRKTLMVPSYIADEMTRIVNEPDSSVKGGGVEYSEDVVFDDRRSMTIILNIWLLSLMLGKI